MGEHLKFPEFDNIPVSTKTFIVMTNININIQNLFETIPVCDYIVVPKRRGRKKKNTVPDPNKNISNGSIVTLELAHKMRGVLLKKKKKKDNKAGDYFRNSVTAVMMIENKLVNSKISRNGKFQMTGCKHDAQAEQCVKYIWEYIKDTDIYTMPEGERFTATFIPAMRNIDFELGFLLDREKLDEYFNTNTEYYSLLETSIGYTGVNIKIPVKISISELKLKRMQYGENDWKDIDFVPYQYYLDTLKPKEQEKKLVKERFNTFLVFHSGKIIMSSMCADFARETYYEFMDIVRKNHKLFEEKLF